MKPILRTDRIKAYMEHEGLNAALLAERIGVSANSVYKWLRCGTMPTMGNMWLLSHNTGIPYDLLVSDLDVIQEAEELKRKIADIRRRG